MTDTPAPTHPGRRARELDIVLFGATGFTGRLVAEHLAARAAETGARIALAGRSREKLEAVRASLSTSVHASASPASPASPASGEIPILVADAADERALEDIASRASVVCTTVGPYAKYGAPLVAACVRRGAHYCDITGEPQFIRRMIDAHHAEAALAGVRIVHTCGFDSIPSDLGTLVLQEYALAMHGAPLHAVRAFVCDVRGYFSGGTLASMFNIIDEVKRDRALRKLLIDPYSLVPDGPRGPDGRDPVGVAYEPRLGGFTAPFVMAGVNMRVVRRSNALLAARSPAYSADFSYTERMSTGRGPKGLAYALGVCAAVPGFVGLAAIPATRRLIEARLPAPGEGPDKEAREKGSFMLRLFGEGRDRDGRVFRVRGVVRGRGDPGYSATSRMLGESALCLAMDGAERTSPSGVGTPASMMGMPLVERLRRVDISFDAEDDID